MKLITGLGNPGEQYINNRHNLGFTVINYIANQVNITGKDFKSEKSSLTAKTDFSGNKLLLVKPLTFMNLSGTAIRQLIDYYKIEIKDILVITEDVYLEFGYLKIREKGSAGGHNGLKSVAQHLGTEHYHRLRIGVGNNQQIPLDQYVLSNFSRHEMTILEEILPSICNCVIDYCKNTLINDLMTRYNGKVL